MTSDYDDLFKIANMKMPFGKFSGVCLIDLPETYIVWFHNQGFPDGDLGRLLAQVYEKAKRYEDMANAINEAEKLSTDPDDKESIRFMRAAMFEKRKQFDAAEREFRALITENPKNASALNYLGYMLADRNVRLTDALDMIRRAVDLDPNNPAYLDSLGWVYYRLGDLDKAEQYLRRAVQGYSKDPTVHDHLGDVLAAKGELKDAVAHWQRSVEEWNAASPSEADPTELAKVQKKLEAARVKLARETRNEPGTKERPR